MPWNCIDCGASNPNDAIFCTSCGRKKEELSNERKRSSKFSNAQKSASSWSLPIFCGIGVFVIAVILIFSFSSRNTSSLKDVSARENAPAFVMAAADTTSTPSAVEASPTPISFPTALPEPISTEAYSNYEIGRKLFDKEDYKHAVPHLKIAAEGSHPIGQRLYGWCLLYGKGTNVDPYEGILWMEKAALYGDAAAQYEMGYCYYAGLGTLRNYEIAVEWYEKAAAQGQKNALLNLGYCYQRGYGVEKDYLKAKEYYTRALEAGNKKAKERLKEINELLQG